MHLALHTTFASSRKEPLGEVVERVHDAILAAGFGEPAVQFVFSEGLITTISIVDRVLKRFPDLAPFVQEVSGLAAETAERARLVHMAAGHAVRPSTRRITNVAETGEVGAAADFASLLGVARGVPRSFPFHDVRLHFALSDFADAVSLPPTPGGQAPGITLRDAWWVNGRQRSLTALRIIEAAASAKTLPPPPDDVAALFVACGKVKKTMQAPVVIGATGRPTVDSVAPEAAQAIRAVVRDYRARMGEIVARARMPHDLPANQDVIRAPLDADRGTSTGPKKPELVRLFTPMGYDCRGESGTFTLRRRTGRNLAVELHVDVGTWSSQVLAFMQVLGLVNGIGFKATLALPPCPRATPRAQYPIVGPEQWWGIVENLAALVAELDHSFVPAIEAAAGPSPAWFQPTGTAAALG